MTRSTILDCCAARPAAVDLPAEIFDVQTNVPLIHQVVVAQLAAARQGTHATKTRGEVRGGGEAVQAEGHRPRPSGLDPRAAVHRRWHRPRPAAARLRQRTPKKMKAAALRGALSDRARHGRIHVVEAFVEGEAPVDQGRRGAARRADRAQEPARRARPRRHRVAAGQPAQRRRRPRPRGRPAQHLRRACADDVVFTDRRRCELFRGTDAVAPATTGRPAAKSVKASARPPSPTDEEASGTTRSEQAAGWDKDPATS
jgi:ribosomal protein L4